MELVSIRDMPYDLRVLLLQELGYNADNKGYVIDNDGKRIVDKYVEREVTVKNMVIVPGSTLILDDNPISIASYVDEYDVSV
ncbi:MAG: hypothetical protein V1822_02515 [Candidatus Micrarchaeota archaeon]